MRMKMMMMMMKDGTGTNGGEGRGADRSEGKVGRRGSAAGNADVTASIPMS